MENTLSNKLSKLKRELNWYSISLGIFLSMFFAAVNAYIGLKVGMTISASIPAAVISMSLARILRRQNNILESNMVQTIASAGESLAAGLIFTIPALYMWSSLESFLLPSQPYITTIALCGGILGVIFMIPLRRIFIVREKDSLIYPEGSACAEVLKLDDKNSEKAKITYNGMFIGALYKLVAEGFKLFPTRIGHVLSRNFPVMLGIDAYPSLLGIGFIIGPKTSSYMLAGALVGWGVFIPLIKETLSADAVQITYTSFELWSNYIRFIGAGCVAAGGVMSIIRILPLIINTIRISILHMFNPSIEDKGEREDLSLKTIFLLFIIVITALMLFPDVRLSIISVALILAFGLLFAIVSSRIVGIIGSSSNPISGMTITTLIFTAFIVKNLGVKYWTAIYISITIGAVVCIILSTAGDVSQDLKTGYLVGATPKYQQVGEIIGILASALVIGFIMNLLNQAYGFGTHKLPAPQASLMKMIVDGVIRNDLPWNLLYVGIMLGLVASLLRIPILPFAIGLYLPIHLSTAIFSGGIIRGLLESDFLIMEDSLRHKKVNAGVLYASGLIGGDGIVGILIAILIVTSRTIALPWNLGPLATLIAFIILALTLAKASIFHREIE